MLTKPNLTVLKDLWHPDDMSISMLNLLVVNHSSRADEEQKSRVFAEKEEEQNFFLLSESMGMKKALWHCLTLTYWDINS